MDSTPERATCPNCFTEISGPFCATCGQEQKELKKYIWTLTGDFFDDVFKLDSRASRSLFAIFFKPGFLTAEYFAGRRARYVPPVRLYLVISFLFFFILPLFMQMLPKEMNQIVIAGEDGQPTENWRDELDENPGNVRLDWLTEEENKKLTKKLNTQLSKVLDQLQEDPASVFMEFMDLLSAVIFFLLPVFAILLKLTYLGSGLYYSEHLLLSIHNHCFLFLALFTTSVLGFAEGTSIGPIADVIESAIVIWIPIYIYLSMRRVYPYGPVVTFFIFSLLGAAYWTLALAGFVFTGLAGIWMA